MHVKLKTQRIGPSMSSTLLQYKRLVGAACHVWACLVLAATLSVAATTEAPGAVPEIVFSHYGLVKPYQALCVLQARRSNPSANITVITHKDSNMTAWDDIAANAGIRIYKPADWDVLNKFEEVYRHSSVNGYDKEMYCIYRHLLLHQYMTEQHVPSLIYLDLDIALFDDLSKLIPPDSTVSRIGTYAIHWTQHSLSAFAHYLWHFYQREPLELAASIAALGISRSKDQKYLAKDPLLSWWPKDGKRYHISDMWLFYGFVKSTGALKVLCPSLNKYLYTADCPPALQILQNVARHQKLKGLYGDYSAELIYQLFEWSAHPQHKFLQPVMSTNTSEGVITSTVPGMHFQGTAKPALAPLLCKDLLSQFGRSFVLQEICREAQVLQQVRRHA